MWQGKYWYKNTFLAVYWNCKECMDKCIIMKRLERFKLNSSFKRHSTVYLLLRFIRRVLDILTFQISLSIFPTAKSLHGCFCIIIHTHTQMVRTRLRDQGQGGEKQHRVVRSPDKQVCVCVSLNVCVFGSNWG